MAETPRVLVSYARADGEELAAELVTRIEAAGIPVWRDRDGLRGGEGWWRQIENALDAVEFLVVVMTPAAVQSEIVRREWDFARRKGVCVFPVIGSGVLVWEEMPGWMSRGHFYDLKFQEPKFLNDLNTRCEKVRVPFMAEELPDNFVPRPELYAQLVAMLIDEQRATPKAITTALRGAGGFGKTTLARALCHDIRTRYVFDDGVLWVTLGEQPVNVAEKLHDLIYALTRERPAFSDAAAASARLRELLEQKSVLIVIDDVWRESDAKPFLVGGPQCAWLLTTRNRDTLPPDAEEIAVDEMGEAEASQLLGASLDATTEDERAALASLASRLGEWPLLLNLANRVLRDRVRRRGEPLLDAIAYANRQLDSQGLQAFDRRNAAAREEAVARTIAVSVELLRQLAPGGDPVARFEELAVFPEDVEIPIAAVERSWGEEVDARELCDHLFNLSLLLAYDLRKQTITLHDVVRTYLLQQVRTEGEQRLHRRLVEAYRTACGGRWHELDDDGYVLQQLAQHLVHADLLADLFALVDRPWRDAKRHHLESDRSFATDVDIAAHVAHVRRNPFQVTRACYIYATLSTRATRVPPTALAAMTRLGDGATATDYAELVRDPIQRSDAFRMIGAALAARGDSVAAREAFMSAGAAADRIDSDPATAAALSALATASAAVDKPFAADAARRALDAARRTDWRARPSELFADVAEAFHQAGLPDEAAGSAERAIADIGSPKIHIYDEVRRQTLLLRAAKILEQAGRHERAAAIRELAEARFRELDAAKRGYGFHGNVAMLIEQLLQAGELDKVGRILGTWPHGHGSQQAQIHAVLGEHSEAAAAAHADQLLALLDNSKMAASDRGDGTPVRDLNRFMRVLVRTGRTAKAMEVAARIRHAPSRADAFGAIALAAAPASPGEARAAIDRAMDVAAIAPQLSAAQVRLMAAAVSAMNKRGKTPRVTRVLSDFDRAKPNEAPIAKEWNHALIQLAAARSLVDRGAAIALLESVRKPWAAAATVQRIRIAIREGRRGEASALAEELLGGEAAAPRARAEAIALTQPDRAVELIATDPERSSFAKAEALLDVVTWRGAAAGGDLVESAERLAREGEQGYHDGSTLARVADAWSKAGATDRAETVAREALELARTAMTKWKTVNRSVTTTDAWGFVKEIGQLAMTRLAEAAATAARITGDELDLVKWAIEATEDLSDQHHKARSLAGVGRALALNGFADDALFLFHTALLSARMAGRDAVFEVIAEAAEAIDAIDEGETLWKIYEEIAAIDGWG